MENSFEPACEIPTSKAWQLQSCSCDQLEILGALDELHALGLALAALKLQHNMIGRFGLLKEKQIVRPSLCAKSTGLLSFCRIASSLWVWPPLMLRWHCCFR